MTYMTSMSACVLAQPSFFFLPRFFTKLLPHVIELDKSSLTCTTYGTHPSTLVATYMRTSITLSVLPPLCWPVPTHSSTIIFTTNTSNTLSPPFFRLLLSHSEEEEVDGALLSAQQTREQPHQEGGGDNKAA